MSNWFEIKISYDKIQENGSVKPAHETFMVDALSFTEAEARIIEERTPYLSGEFNVAAVKRSKIVEVFDPDTPDADKWYLAKVAFITIDPKSAVEKRTIAQSLVHAGSLPDAVKNLIDGMKGTLADYQIVSVAETPILDLYRVKLS